MGIRGRPSLQCDATILEAALDAFATNGFDSRSVRALSSHLGLSHETIDKRFGTKLDLYRAAVSQGLLLFVTEFDREITALAPIDDLERLRATVPAFMIAASHHPTLDQLLNHQGIGVAERDLLMTEIGLGERMTEVADLLSRLQSHGVIRGTTLHELSIFAQGAAAPLHLDAIAATFDPSTAPSNESITSRR